ncbi:hypothetical protein A3F58_02485 [Candidatus Roizmanbacteria bacterium RIFCSPHIGHO2_12_FULL_37_9b]|uniref:Uncharacterized protein n=1 Tax=Candidatus Roizmanbacteria bacterium RIFCSPHIGHO2_02_FULL_38_11 TaxID=1802039 RepID=A0A1F7GWI9_9BACT|nr:MAG: hypothetical protein A3C25_06260 [Candidatus Roizmanbacteria bacterium RIFCSPHIGHO2_02_FULL_38_11]OGK35150.1 MAG: hypothetical protein A3F58_02485 [Candidatus Roizmanbacteria bacterium RIFCSPHIGHO2_12_FULL_37_9b]
MNRNEVVKNISAGDEYKFVGLSQPIILYLFHKWATHKGVVEEILGWNVDELGSNFIAGYCAYDRSSDLFSVTGESVSYPEYKPSSEQLNQLVDTADIRIENW